MNEQPFKILERWTMKGGLVMLSSLNHGLVDSS